MTHANSIYAVRRGMEDNQEDMIDRYLDKGRMYVLDDNGIKCECVVTDEGNGTLEIKNLVITPQYQCRAQAGNPAWLSKMTI